MTRFSCGTCGWWDRDERWEKQNWGVCRENRPNESGEQPAMEENAFCPGWKCQEWVQLFMEQSAKTCKAEVMSFINNVYQNSTGGEVYDDSIPP